jgi:hypothetical protein
MTTLITITVGVCCNDEYADNTPSHVAITLDYEDIIFIKKARKYVKDLDAFRMEKFWYGCSYKFRTEDDGPFQDWEGSLETETLCVSDTEIQVTAYLKHTNVEIFSETIPIKEVLENWRVIKARPKFLPLLINELAFESSKGILEVRLRGGKTLNRKVGLNNG